MNTTVAYDAAFMQDLSIIAQDESLFNRLVKYVRRLAQPKDDPTRMTKTEFFAKVDEALEEAQQGKVTRQLPGESVTDMLKRTGYVL